MMSCWCKVVPSPFFRSLVALPSFVYLLLSVAFSFPFRSVPFFRSFLVLSFSFFFVFHWSSHRTTSRFVCASEVIVLPSYACCVASQPFFANAPPLLSVIWFGEDERVLATTIACNANVLGIAGAYLLAPLVVGENANDRDRVPTLNEIIGLACFATALIATFLFRDRPFSPPSRAAEIKRSIERQRELAEERFLHRQLRQKLAAAGTDGREREAGGPALDFGVWDNADFPRRLGLGEDSASGSLSPTDHDIAILPASYNRNASQADLADTEAAADSSEALRMPSFREELWSYWELIASKPGFLHTVLIFSVAESSINAFSTFLNQMLIPLGFAVQGVGYLGAGFIVACLLGSTVFGYLVDRTKAYRAVVVFVLLCAMASLLVFLLVERHDLHLHTSLIVALVLCLGFFLGPLQPIAFESAAECTYPVEESQFAAVLQLSANVFSTALVPLMQRLHDSSSDGSMTDANWLNWSLLALAALVFAFWNGEKRRSEFESRHYQTFS